MVNLSKWDEVDFFDIKVGDKIKGIIEVGPTLTQVVRGKAVFTNFSDDNLDGSVKLEKDGEVHLIVRSRDQGKPEGTTLYRRKALTQEEKDDQFKLPEKLGAIVSAVGKNSRRYDTTREYFVWDGGEWSTAHACHDSSELRSKFKEFKLVRKGIEVG